MRQPNDAVREHLVRVLDWEDAHVGFDKAVAGIPPEARGHAPPASSIRPGNCWSTSGSRRTTSSTSA